MQVNPMKILIAAAFAALLLLSYAVAERNPVFIALQIYQLCATVLIYLLSRSYRASGREIHECSSGSVS